MFPYYLTKLRKSATEPSRDKTEWTNASVFPLELVWDFEAPAFQIFHPSRAELLIYVKKCDIDFKEGSWSNALQAKGPRFNGTTQ